MGYSLTELETRLLKPISIPVIGRCLQKKAVTALAEDNSPEAVKVLAKAVTRLKDEEIKEIVLDALGKLRNQQCIDVFCQVWANTRHRDLTKLLVKKGWVASAPINIKVLSALKAKQLQVVTNGGQEIVESLLNTFQDKDSEIANRASECAISLTNSEAIDIICQKWATTRNELLEQLVCQGKYVARQPIELKVLTALKIGKLQVIKDGGQEIIESLLNALKDRDSEIANRASECAVALNNPEVIDIICQKWTKTRDKLLEQLVCQGKYVARQPTELKVLTALKVDKFQVIKDGGKEIVEPLLNALKDRDSEIANRASECAVALNNPEVIDIICQKWAETRDKTLEQLVCQGKYVARQPTELKVLTALKVDKFQVIKDGGKEIVEPLLNALKDRDSEIANRASECAVALNNPEVIDIICQKWAETRDKTLEQLVCQGRYIARQPTELKVLTALKVDKFQVIKDGGKEIVEPLLNALKDRDSEIANRASECAVALNNSEAIDIICQKWAETRDKTLEQLVCQGKYVARQPTELKVLTALKVGKFQVIKDGGKEIVEPLLNALKDRDSEIANRASECAVALNNPDSTDYICRLAIEQDQQIAHQIAIKAQYAPREPNQRALFYFLTEQWDKYESLDYENTLLQKVYELGDEKLRKQIADKARQAGSVAWVQIVAGGLKGQRLGEMTDSEWDITLNVLNSGKQWEEMWQLAQESSAIRSSQLLQKLEQVAWIPKGEQERKSFEKLKQLADKCLEKTMPMGKLTCCQATLTHDSLAEIDFIDFSPDGQILASCSTDNTIRLWRMPDGKPLATLNYDSLGEIGFSPDGQLLAGHDMRDNTIKLWRMPDGKPLATFNYDSEECISFSPDGQLLASYSRDKTIRLWGMPDGKPLATLTGHTAWVYGISFSPDGQLLASFSWDKTIRLWGVPDGKSLATLTGHTGLVHGISFSPDGQLLASYSRDFKSKYHELIVWSSPVFQLSHLPIKQLSLQKREWVEKALKEDNINKEERNWLEFMQALMDWHGRFDVEVEDVPQLIGTGEFDIEIEG